LAPTPHYLRFARALALVSGIAAPGCATHHEITPTTDAAPTDSAVADAGTDAPPTDPCSRCDCVFGGDTPPPPTSCEAMGTAYCCYAIGPLLPPELPA
jgi:hypothetical protein